MKIKKIKSIVNLIITCSWNGKKRIDDLIIEDILYSSKLSVDEDVLINELGDPRTSSYNKLIREIQSTISYNNTFSKIEIFEEYDGFYIQKRHNNTIIDKKYDEVISFINSFNNEKKNKGVIYEKFCKLFLEDLGISCESTAISNDKGIDIKGSYKTNFKDDITNLIFNEEIYLLVQVKYFATAIDTPVIRKLVGDSLFIRFDELEYLDIKHNAIHLIVFSHNGFTNPAKKFADKNKVRVFDSVQIAHIISDKPEKDWKCLKFIF
ncbi:restriction endonuclease [Dokdonia sp.]|uniref:restriction endonuclease n=1 Tax=Dokdonia sp. TaxID=2024995 RepID=UPI0032641BB6